MIAFAMFLSRCIHVWLTKAELTTDQTGLIDLMLKCKKITKLSLMYDKYLVTSNL